jgi:hypothetical protein
LKVGAGAGAGAEKNSFGSATLVGSQVFHNQHLCVLLWKVLNVGDDDLLEPIIITQVYNF